ncbi:MAG: hypothetical protein COU25_03195 [Candidatus Levybacteria bacterium CG10_big_fil_rev_8_21_14_0_10_35_13]|nr:MAG: hypothetical protein COU25_03195 [Candidatus Levybacteria bacterium CG10_big_fil_rev_8_21_14_0_10_35_13]
MEILPKYTLTQEMVSLISRIEAKKAILENANISSQIISRFQRQSLLKSSLYSAKIEGNPLKEKDLENLSKFDKNLRERLEIENIISALKFLKRQKDKTIDKNFIPGLHEIVMKNISIDAGRLRVDPNAIFNQAGFSVYIPPLPSQVSGLLEELVAYVNNSTNENILIKAALAHMVFEKIHPFLDGNGRVGRLLYQSILIKNNYHFNWLLSVEEEINDKKEEYYAYLDKNDATSFIEFSLEVLLANVEKISALLNEEKEDDKELFLLPRRKEILDLIRDHKFMSLDVLRRRFSKVSPRMIRYDLKKLEEEGFIIKIGSTRGAVYKVK